MALSSLLIQRSLNSFSILRRSLAAAPAIAALSSSSSSSPICIPSYPFSRQSPASSSWQKWSPLLLQSRQFRSSPVSLSSSSSLPERRFEPSYTWSYEEFKPRELGIDEIAGCDFNHWLIVMDFPKDPRPSPNEMVGSYEETCAKALNISVEVAKKKIYACSTSNYTGFHVEATEVESEKFNGQPGVVFVLPDSYVDPERKEYGGDKYINGVIIPRPRTTLNGRRNQVQPNHDQQGGPMQNQKGNPSFSHESPTRGGSKPNQQRNSSSNHQGLTPQSLPSKQSYNLPGQGERKGPPNHPSQQNHGQPGLKEVIVPQKSHDRPALGETRDPQNYSPERNYNLFGQGDRRDIVPTAAPRGGNGYQEGSGGLIPSYPGNYNQEEAGNIYAQEQRGCAHGEQWNYASPRQQGCPRDDCQFYCPPQGTHYGQGVGGYQVHGAPESYWQGANSTDDNRFYGPPQGTHCGQGVGGYQVHGAPESYWQGANSTDDYRFYGPPQGTRYGQGVGGYQVQGAPESYWQGANSTDDYRFYGPPQGTRYGQGVGGYQVQGAQESYWQGANSRDDYRFYGPPQGLHYGQRVGRYQVQGAPESYWQGANSRDDYRFNGLPQDMHYGQGVGGDQVQGAPESYWQGANSRDDYRFYGPPQDMHYGQGVGGYQVQGAPESYWRGANCSAFGQGTSFGYGQGYPKPIQGHSFSQQEQTNVQCGSFYPQEQREFSQGYQINHAPPRYERGFSKYYGNYGLPQRTPYGHGAGEYQSYGAPEAWQGECFRAVGQGLSFSHGQGYSGHIKGQGFSQEQPRNMQQQGVHYYSLEQREFPQGGQANYAPPRHHGGFREHQNQNCGRGQGTPYYGQVIDEYQGYGTHVAYWHGLKY